GDSISPAGRGPWSPPWKRPWPISAFPPNDCPPNVSTSSERGPYATRLHDPRGSRDHRDPAGSIRVVRSRYRLTAAVHDYPDDRRRPRCLGLGSAVSGWYSGGRQLPGPR